MRRSEKSVQLPGGSFSRREILKAGGAAAAASLAGMVVGPVHASEDNTLHMALIGSGGRGSGAVGNAIGASRLEGAGCFGPVKLVAMADVFEHRVQAAHKALADQLGPCIDVPPERRFFGFDAYRKAIDCLRPGDIALLTAHAGFRQVHLDYAVEKGVHVFMEKSFAADPGGLKRMLRAGERANRKNLKIAAGLMCRHSPARQALIRKVRDGELGDLIMINAYRLDGAIYLGPRPADANELLWQVGHPGVAHLFWASAGLMSEMVIHQIDECCWLKDAWPVSAHGMGGRVPNQRDYGQNHHTYHMEFTFADGGKALVDARYMPAGRGDFVTYVHGSRHAAQFSGFVHQSEVHTYQDQRIDNANITWRADRETRPLHQYTWELLLDSIRNDKPLNETERAICANLTAIMGRAAVHTGEIVTWDQVLASDFQFVENLDAITADSPAPIQADEHGCYPVPIPGQWTEL
jgi:predicted dehydrogenase